MTVGPGNFVSNPLITIAPVGDLPSVTAEVASSSLVVPAILFKRLSGALKRMSWYAKRYTVSCPSCPDCPFSFWQN